MSEKKKIRIKNTTAGKVGTLGQILDYKNTIIRPGGVAIMAVDVVDEVLESWNAKGWIQIQNADTGDFHKLPADSIITPGTVLEEAKASDLDLDESEIDFDPSVANEAVLPPPIGFSGDLAQDQRRARVSLGSEDGSSPADGGLSPIPGDRPKNVDDSDKFTVKAPRYQGPGAIMR